jgi:hypothetical protein
MFEEKKNTSKQTPQGRNRGKFPVRINYWQNNRLILKSARLREVKIGRIIGLLIPPIFTCSYEIWESIGFSHEKSFSLANFDVLLH